LEVKVKVMANSVKGRMIARAILKARVGAFARNWGGTLLILLPSSPSSPLCVLVAALDRSGPSIVCGHTKLDVKDLMTCKFDFAQICGTPKRATRSAYARDVRR
jgi:hypothetical protein